MLLTLPAMLKLKIQIRLIVARSNAHLVNVIDFNCLKSVSHSNVHTLYLMLNESSIFFILAK